MIARLLSGTFWNGLASALNQGGTFLGSVIIARMLGQVVFGQYAIVLATLMSVAVLAQTGLALAATKYIAEFRSVDPARTGRIVGLCSVLGPALAAVSALGLAVAAPFVAGPMLGSAKLALPLALGAVFILFYAMNSYQVGALTGLERYRALMIPAAVCTVLTVAGIAAGAKFAGVTGAIAGLSIASAVRWYLHQRALKVEFLSAGIDISLEGMWRELPLLYSFAIPAALAGYLMIPGLWITNAWLVREPGGYSQLAHFSAAQTLRLMVMFVPLLVNSVGLAILNNVRAGSSAGSYASAHRLNRLALTGSTAAGALLMALCGRWVLGIFGHEFAGPGNWILWLLLASTVLESMFLGCFQTIQAAGRMWLALGTVVMPWQTVFVTAAYFLIPRFAAAGLAAAYLSGIGAALLATLIAAGSVRKHEISWGSKGQQGTFLVGVAAGQTGGR